MNVFLENSAENFFQRMETAGIYALLGLGIVLTVLAVIWGVLSVFGVVFRFNEAKNAKKMYHEASLGKGMNADDVHHDHGCDQAQNGDSHGDADVGDDVEIPDEDNEAVVAAITAAVSLILRDEAEENETSPSGFRVVAFRRSGKGTPWCG